MGSKLLFGYGQRAQVAAQLKPSVGQGGTGPGVKYRRRYLI